jgi:hypothetical protein
MNTETLNKSTQRPGFWKAALYSGIIIFIMDGLAACINAYLSNGVSPERVWIYVSSGVFGKSAFSGGMAMAAWGLFFHFIVASSWTIFYFLIYRIIKTKNDILAGACYGVFVWVAMNFVVVPLSQVPPSTFRLRSAIIMLLIHIFVIGIPIALLAKRYFRKINQIN